MAWDCKWNGFLKGWVLENLGNEIGYSIRNKQEMEWKMKLGYFD